MTDISAIIYFSVYAYFINFYSRILAFGRTFIAISLPDDNSSTKNTSPNDPVPRS